MLQLLYLALICFNVYFTSLSVCVCVCWWGMCWNACVRYQHATRSKTKGNSKAAAVSFHSIRSRNPGEHCEWMWFMTCFQHDNDDDDDDDAVAAKFKEMCNNVSGRTGVSYLFVLHPPPPSIPSYQWRRHDKISLKRAENSARAQETVMHMFVCVWWVMSLDLNWVGCVRSFA